MVLFLLLLSSLSINKFFATTKNTTNVVMHARKSETAPANHTPVRPSNLGRIIKHGISNITCHNKLKNIDIFTFPID